MNKERFNHLLGHLNDVTNEDIKSLNELRKKYPFFQTPYVIVAKALKDLNHPKTDAFVRKAAVYSPDRAHLKKIITGELVFDKEVKKSIDANHVEIQEAIITTAIPTLEQKEVSSIELPKVETPFEAKKQIETVVENKEVTILPVVEKPAETNLNIKEEQLPPTPSTITPSKLVKSDQINELEKDLIEIRERKQRLAKMLNQQDNKVEEQKNAPKKERKSQVELIEKFIQNEPQFGKQKDLGQDSEYHQEDLATKKLKYRDEFATETLAALLFKQKKYERALDIYEKLSLKFPEKRTYFALQIQKIKESQHV
ncbi:MAG: hypothetical protein ACI9Z3_000219 [Roseivirga sp.]